MCLTCDVVKEAAKHFNKPYYGHIIEESSNARALMWYLASKGYASMIEQKGNSLEVRLPTDTSCKDIRNNELASLVFRYGAMAFHNRIDNTLYGYKDVDMYEGTLTWVNQNCPEIAPYVVLTKGYGCVTITVNGEIQ